MLFFVLPAAVNSSATIINKVIGLEARKSLGAMNGALINYLEATVTPLVTILLLDDSRLADPSHWSAVPLVNLLSGASGLMAMVLTVIAMERVHISYSTIISLVGQLGTGFILDAIAAGKIIPLKLFGLLTATAGIFLDQMAMGRSTETHLKEQE